nr:hypothetical protein [Actinacidiphila soli]
MDVMEFEGQLVTGDDAGEQPVSAGVHGGLDLADHLGLLLVGQRLQRAAQGARHTDAEDPHRMAGEQFPVRPDEAGGPGQPGLAVDGAAEHERGVRAGVPDLVQEPDVGLDPLASDPGADPLRDPAGGAMGARVSHQHLGHGAAPPF